MIQSNPYQILGVHPTADEEEIKRAYRRLAMEFHPDRNSGDCQSADRFRDINLAFEILRDPKKRDKFDRWGLQRMNKHSTGSSSATKGKNFALLFYELFGDLMGGKPMDSTHKAKRGSDLKHHITITLEEAALGTTTPIQIDRLETCEDCQGKGAPPDTQIQSCAVCGGSGNLQKQRGLVVDKVSCKSCDGTGQIRLDVCRVCKGNGQKKRNRTLNVRIPAGTEEEFTLKMNQEGNAGTFGGSSGDLLISVGIQPHEMFRKEGQNLHISVPITMTDAALGTKIDVPTLSDSVQIKVPAGTQSGNSFCLQGKGFPRSIKKARGDIIVKIHVETPTKISLEQRKLLEEFNRLKKIGKYQPPEETPKTGFWVRSTEVIHLLKRWFS